ncbi:MAG: hypothetical protein ACD_79C00761G0007 [uncultured bacterium]|nr:MAG: hypothetical protein ACD_79C00761G0007 [uncultured bacterium]
MKNKRNNCWEIMRCGREPGGKNSEEKGTCPACTHKNYSGINKGQNAGRFCWAIAGTICQGEVQGTFAKKFHNCLKCPFYLEVEKEEGSFFTVTPPELVKKVTSKK